MNKELIKIYDPDPSNENYIELDLPEGIEYLEKIRLFQGYREYYRFFKSSFSTGEDDILEIVSYVKDGDKNSYIIELWNPNERILAFYIKNELHFFDFIQKYSCIRKNLFSYEVSLKSLLEKE